MYDDADDDLAPDELVLAAWTKGAEDPAARDKVRQAMPGLASTLDNMATAEDERIQKRFGRIAYTAVKIESAVVDKHGEGVLSLEVLAADSTKVWVDIDGITPGMVLDALLAARSQD